MKILLYIAWLIFCVVIGYIIFTYVRKDQPKYNPPPIHPDDKEDEEGELMTDDEEKQVYQEWEGKIENDE